MQLRTEKLFAPSASMPLKSGSRPCHSYKTMLQSGSISSCELQDQVLTPKPSLAQTTKFRLTKKIRHCIINKTMFQFGNHALYEQQYPFYSPLTISKFITKPRKNNYSLTLIINKAWKQ